MFTKATFLSTFPSTSAFDEMEDETKRRRENKRSLLIVRMGSSHSGDQISLGLNRSEYHLEEKNY